MRQLLCDLATGELTHSTIPLGPAAPGKLRVRVHHSVISTGTEQMLLSFGTSSWLERARDQPERVRQVLERVQAQGVMAAVEAVKGRLDTPLALGYACAGEVIAVGEGVRDFVPGDRVTCNGPHADVVHVSERLCAAIPPGVTYEHAAFTTLASIALHGVRLSGVSLGERVLVLGLGVVGQLAVQVLDAAGCVVMGVEPDSTRASHAREHLGIQVYEPESLVDAGFDAVLVCTTSGSPEPLIQAIEACRRRGRVVLVGTGQIKLERALLYEREVSLQVASSYGPGRYTRAYEERGLDYPIEHVRWTAQRNFEAVLGMMARGKLDVGTLIQERAPFGDAPSLYARLTDPHQTPPLAMMLDYEVLASEASARDMGKNVLIDRGLIASDGEVRLGVIGAGLYAQRTFLPALGACEGVHRARLVSRGGEQAAWLARRESFASVGTDADALCEAKDIDLVAILTRHDTHAALTQRALEAGKHVFVEKPLARNAAELDALMSCATTATGLLMVGFNRRYAPMTRALGAALSALNQPASIAITVNAGALPDSHWLHDAAQGGRILGEACHFIDLARALAGAPITHHHVQCVGSGVDAGALITLGFEDGSAAHISYLTAGPGQLVKERVEVCCAGRAARIEGWSRLRVWGWPGLKSMRQLRADKGHAAMLHTLFTALREATAWPTPLAEIEEVARVTIALADAHRAGHRA